MYADAINLLRDETLKTKCMLLGVRVMWGTARSSYLAYAPVDVSMGLMGVDLMGVDLMEVDHIGIMDRDPHRAAEMLLDVLSNPHGS